MYKKRRCNIHMCVCVYIYMRVYIYIKKKWSRGRDVLIYTYIYIHMYIHDIQKTMVSGVHQRTSRCSCRSRPLRQPSPQIPFSGREQWKGQEAAGERKGGRLKKGGVPAVTFAERGRVLQCEGAGEGAEETCRSMMCRCLRIL